MFSVLFFCAGVQAGVFEYRFSNGLKLLVKEDHRAPVVVSQVWYKIGSSYEYDGLTGISHALEHMMFKGTKTHPPGEFSRIISANGGRENAFTGSDYTAYFQTLEKSRLKVSFELESDRMRNLSLPAAEFKKEIEVVKEERRWRTEDKPQAYTREVAFATAYQTSPYRHPVIGWMADLEAMKIADVRDWYRQWYAPNNATLVVVGDVDPEAVHSLAKKYFAGLKPEKITIQEPRPEVPQAGVKRITVKRPAEVPYLLMGYKVPVLKTTLKQSPTVAEWEPYALDVLAGVLDGGSSARFASRLIRGQEIAASVGAGYDMTDRLDTLFVISGTPSQGHTTAQLEQAITAELKALQANPVDEKELERVKAQVVSGDVYQRDSVFYQAMILGNLETVGLSWRLADEYVGRIQSVTGEQVQQVARKYFNNDRLTVAVLEPQPMDKQRRRPRAGVPHHAY
ncbi:MAG: M16 family metallopeptidase [Gammaproteobacteria bacterium]